MAAAERVNRTRLHERGAQAHGIKPERTATGTLSAERQAKLEEIDLLLLNDRAARPPSDPSYERPGISGL